MMPFIAALSSVSCNIFCMEALSWNTFPIYVSEFQSLPAILASKPPCLLLQIPFDFPYQKLYFL